MNRDQVRAVLRPMLADQLGIAEEEILPQSRFVDDLGADSLDIVEFVMTVEDHFPSLGQVPNEMLEHLATFGLAVAYIAENAREP